MGLEIWLAWAAAALLALAIGAQELAVLRVYVRWRRVVLGTRIGAAFALLAAMVSLGSWLPYDLRQAWWELALSVLLVNLVLVARTKTEGAGPAVDGAGLALVLVGSLLAPGPSPACAQWALPLYLQWVLFLLGGGSAVVAGSAGLMLLFRSLWARFRARSPGVSSGSQAFVWQASALAWTALGLGLAVGGFWGWLTIGALSSGSAREGWMAMAWLVISAGLLALGLGKSGLRRAPWPRGLWAALAALSAALAVVGLSVAVVPGSLF